ncbi:MAG: alkaline phosphatase D family protein [Gemmatimonadaceae bacterium]|nr:alkaline phosphatase D family protein [Gemmatimonadaceae bacterium]
MVDPHLTRRSFLGASLAAGVASVIRPRSGWLPAHGAPAIITAERLRPLLPSGVQVGDVLSTRAMLWSRADRPARLHIEWDTTDAFRHVRRLVTAPVRAVDDHIAHVDLAGLPPGQTIHYRVRFESDDSPGAFSEPLAGSFRTAPVRADRPLRVAFSGDMVGQGWGIDDARGGIRMYEALRRAEPDVFIHSGDNIYADNPLQAEVALDDGTVWRNLVTPAKAKVAETLDEFRGCFAYNLLDANAQRFGASVPIIAQWDDHEVCNNWYDELVLANDARYSEKRVHVLAQRAKQALFDYLPIRRNPTEAGRVYRSFSYGPLLEVFVLDMRSYRSANSPNREASGAHILGDAQLAWLERGLTTSRAQWKVVASDMPLGLVVMDPPNGGPRTYEAVANGDPGAPSGRERELAQLLQRLKQARVRNVVWVTADVHYCAAHYYTPERARFTGFDPFWEFVAGPMHAGTFGPNELDATFGPEVRFASTPPKPNRPPSDNYQFYGTLDIDPTSRALTAGLWDVTGKRLWSTELAPEPSAR